ncbi:MAG TPA: CPBP family intramembrane glutamic endopeptidase [Roseiflexaceae bacterium]|jgi:membrane protease YdiL (CAAX protease family)|nr:CPBP family intramembrane glutamic endopeptidase [Roseiflexaceae bacterium]
MMMNLFKRRKHTPPARDLALLGGLALAYVSFAQVFRGRRARFWPRMTRTGAILGSLSLASEPELRETRIGVKDVVIGLGSAGVLYIIFQIGDRFARWLLPKGSTEIASIYDLRTLGPTPVLAGRLALIIGPAEELFWRGLVQRRLMREYGPVVGTAAGTALYGGAHLVTGNVTLIGAASVAGAFWGGLYALGVPMGALIVSHAAWDVFTFLIAPTERPERSK